MRAVLLHKIHINKITLEDHRLHLSQHIQHHYPSAPGRGNLLLCTLTWEMAPNQAGLPQASLCDQPGLECEAQQCWQWLCCASCQAATAFPCTDKSQHLAGCAALELLLLYIQVSLPVPCAALGQQNQLHGMWYPQVLL